MSSESTGREHLVRRHLAVMAVFKRFSAVWRQAFAASRHEDLLESWLDGLAGIDTDHLEPGARIFLQKVEAKFPPKAWEFARFLRDHYRVPGSASNAPLIKPKRVWEWESPETRRLSRVEEREDGWVFHALDDPETFLAMTNSAKGLWCDEMVQHHYVRFPGAA